MSNEDKRRIKLDLRRSLDSPDSQFMMILLDPDARKIRDLVDMIKQLSPGMEDSDEVKVYQGKYLLLPDVDIGVIETQKEVIIIHCAKTEDVKIKKEYCEGFEALLQQDTKVQMKIVSTQTDSAPVQPVQQTHVKIASTQTAPLPTQPMPQPRIQKVTSIEFIGNKSMNIRNGKLLVQGPDQAEAIARKLRNGEAELAMVSGNGTGDGKWLLVLGRLNNNNDASSNTSTAKRLCTELKK